ncbi:CAP domain-containing protein [Yinghuangia aomiensis]
MPGSVSGGMWGSNDIGGADLTPGANRALPTGTLTMAVPGPFDLSLLITGDSGRVSGDADFVFFNQTTAPGVTLRDATAAAVDPPRLRAGATRVTLVVSPADPSARLGALPTPTLTVATSATGVATRFTPHPVTRETVLLLAELYHRNGIWKIRAIGQGYADGLAGIARDFGVDVTEDTESPTAPPTSPPPSTSPGSPHFSAFAPGVPSSPLAQWRTEVIALTNAERTRAGLGTLTEEARLTTAAQSHSDDMAGRNYFDHTGLDGRHPADRVTAAGYTYRRCAENIAAGQQTPAEVVDGWMNSPGHRANILTPDLTQIGIGIAHGGTYGIYWTQVFGTPMGSANPFGG